MTKTSKRMGWAAVVTAALVTTLSATALAEGKDCEGRAEARFQKKDQNGDGFLTATEVGTEKWARIQVADADKDGKVSLAELKQAKADGKLGKGKKDKDKKPAA